MFEEDYKYKSNEVRESRRYRDSSTKLTVSNEDFYSGNGCIHINIQLISTGANLGFWINNYNSKDIEELKSIFRPIKEGQIQSIIHTTSEVFSIDNKYDNGAYKIGINKLIITSSGRSSSGMSIVLNKGEIEEICDIICGLTQAEMLHKRKKEKK